MDRLAAEETHKKQFAGDGEPKKYVRTLSPEKPEAIAIPTSSRSTDYGRDLAGMGPGE
jgi:hypothetical protein